MRSASGVLVVALALAAACRQGPAVWVDEGQLPGPAGTLHFRVAGTGPDTIVAVPGGPGLSMEYLRDALIGPADRFTWITYDPRGRGGSAPVADSAPLGLARDLEDLDAVRRHFRLNELRLMGHGWGAAVAAHYAAAYPDLVSRVVLVSPFPINQVFVYGWNLLDRDTLRFRQGALATPTAESAETAAGFCRRFWFWYFQPVYIPESLDDARAARAVCSGPPETLTRPAEWQQRWLRTSAAHDWGGAFRTVAAPTLVLEGNPPGNSHRLYQVHAEHWAGAIPGARALMLPGASLLPWLANPKGFEAAVRSFLGGEWPAAAYLPATTSAAAGQPTMPLTIPRSNP